MNFRMKHPNKDKVAIDYDAAMVMLPMVLCGSSFGVLLNSVLPDAIITILLTLLLFCTCIKCFFKARNLWAKESEKMRRKNEEEEEFLISDEVKMRKLNGTMSDSASNMFGNPDINASPSQALVRMGQNTKVIQEGGQYERERLEFYKEENSHFQWKKLMPIFVVLVGTILQTLLRGGKGSPSIAGIGKCSGGYWGVLGAFVVISLVATVYSVVYLEREYRLKRICGYVFDESDLNFSLKNTLILCSVAFIGGVMAAIVGIGGGVIFNPMLLEFGLPPQVASNTGMYLVIYTTFSNTFQFMANHVLNY